MAKRLLLGIEQALSLDDDIALIGALGKIAANWVTLASKIDGATTVVAFIDQLAKDAASEDIKTALRDIGVDPDMLSDFLKKVKDATDAVPAKYKMLLDPLSSPDAGPVDWTLKGSAATPADGEYSLKLDGSGGIEFRPDAKWAFNDPMPPSLLQISAEGAVHAAGAATLPFKFGSVGGSADGQVTVGLDYYFSPSKPDLIYGLAVAQCLPDLANPFALDDLWESFAHGRLAGLVYTFKDAATVTGTISVAETVELLDLASLKAGLDVKFGLSLTGKQTFSVRAAPRPADAPPGSRPPLVVTLSRSDGRQNSLDLTAGLALDLSGLAKRIHDILGKAYAEWDAILADVKPFLSPGTWLQDKAGALVKAQATALLGDTALSQAVQRDLQGLLGLVSGADSAVADWLGKQLTDAVERTAGVLTKDAGAAADAAYAELSRLLPAFAQDAFKTKLNDALNKLIGQGQSDLETALKKIVQGNSNKLGTAITAAGGQVNAAVARADGLLAGLRDLVDKYSMLFQKVIKATEDSARTQIAARFLFEQQTSSDSTYQYSATLTASTEAARTVFDSLVHGNLSELVALLEMPTAQPGVSPNLDLCSISKFTKRVSSTGFELVALGFSGISASTVLTTQASAIVAAGGRVEIGAQAELDRRFKGANATRDLTFADVYKLTALGGVSAGLPGATRSFELGLGILHSDPEMSRKELAAFIGSLEGGGLVSKGTQARATSFFDAWSGPGTQAPLSADISVKLRLDGKALLNLLQLNARAPLKATLHPLTRAGQKVIIGRALTTLFNLKAVDPDYFRKIVAWVAEGNAEPVGATMSDIILDERNPVHRGASLDADTYTDDFVRERTRLMALVDAIDLLGDVYLAHYSADPKKDPTGWDETHYRQAQDDIGAAISKWFFINRNFIFWIKPEIHPRTIALFRTIRDLAGEGAGVSVVMTNKPAGKAAQTVVLV